MNTTILAILVFMQLPLVALLIWMIWNEKKVIAFERRLYHRWLIKKERKVYIKLRQEAINGIKNVLKELGVKIELLHIERMANPERWLVKVNGKYFGIYDADKKTFIERM